MADALLDADEVMDGVYLGSMYASRDRPFFERANIRTVLSMAKIEPAFAQDPDLNVQYHVVDILDTKYTNILEHLPECLRFIEEGLKRGSVLLHCHAGVSRSAAVAVALLMKHRQIDDARTALVLLRSKRPCVSPHEQFLDQMQLFASMNWTLDPENAEYRFWIQRRAEEEAAHAITRSMVTLSVNPADIDTDLVEMDTRIRSIRIDGLSWGSGREVPLAFGIKRLEIAFI
eukprot:CAMPEP_0174242480 /NCGR_PEP_ID=MMETSP0417-20130205/28077_1 /TAXON_ID=242541 /ORGANISM="Mayorella sp, Strain BSH-02190019" /LENGTH=230 /DNA_ID=CAMNT_0015321881 /DNA_START=54 /DNA_END=743 /DNA_ORIENTATION=+